MLACKKSAPFDPIWPRLARLAVLAKFCPVRPFLASFGPGLLCLASFGTIWPCLALISPTQPCFATLQFLSQGTLRYFKVPIRQGVEQNNLKQRKVQLKNIWANNLFSQINRRNLLGTNEWPLIFQTVSVDWFVSHYLYFGIMTSWQCRHSLCRWVSWFGWMLMYSGLVFNPIKFGI